MLINILETAFNLIISLDKDLFEIINLSLKVTISALIIAVSVSIPLGAFLVFYKNKFQSFIVLIANTLMGMPPVVLGLLIYTLVSKKRHLWISRYTLYSYSNDIGADIINHAHSNIFNI